MPQPKGSMRIAITFIAGTSSTLMLTVLVLMICDTRTSHIEQIFPQARIEDWSAASLSIWIGALATAVALPLSFAMSVVARQRWPARSFAVGAIAGVLIGAAVAIACVAR